MDTLREILTGLHPDVDFDVQMHLIDEGILDSFDIVTLVGEIDLMFGVVIPAQDLTPENLNSLTALYNLVRRLEEG